MKISVIIPTCKGREKEIKNTLNSLLKFSKDILEIIVSIDESLEIKKYIKELSKKNKKVKFLFSPQKRGRCKAKNEAVKIAKGEIIFFFDDDIEILSKNYFRKLKKYFLEKNIGAVAGREIKPKKTSKVKSLFFGKKVGKVSYFGEIISNFSIKLKKPVKVDFLPGSNFGVRKDIFIAVGGFDENYDIGTAYREETDLHLKIKKMGYELIFDSSVVILHKEKETPKSFKNWFKWYYILNTYFFMKNFSPNFLKLLLFFLKEMIGSIFRCIIYKKPYPIIFFPKIFSGIKYFYQKSYYEKSVDNNHSF